MTQSPTPKPPEAENTWTVAAILAATADFLAKKGAAAARLDAELLLARVLKMARVQLYINFEAVLTDEQLGAYRELVRRRAKLEPVAYILGEKEFYGLKFKVNPSVLIPRPETEHLVDEGVRMLKGQAAPLAADIGCGSGAIAAALAHALPAARVSAVDISAEALAVARDNAAALGVEDRVNFYEGDLAAPLSGAGSFDLICANLPYIPTGEMATLMTDVAAFEPHLALDGGPDGLSLINKLIEQAFPLLKSGGHILLEIWPDSLGQLNNTAQSLGYEPGEAIRDLAGKARIAVLRKP